MTPKLKATVCAVVLAAAAAGSGMYFKEKERWISSAVETVTVLRTKRYVAAGKNLTPDAVEEAAVPEAFVPPGALRSRAELLNARGKAAYKARIGLPKADVLTKSKLAEDSSLMGLAWTLQAGETALSLRLAGEDAVSGLLRPGDLVNLLVSTKNNARVVLAGARVGAVGDKLWDAAAGDGADFSKTSMAGDTILVTLILSPAEALAARHAAEQGRLSLALMSPLETNF